MEGKRRMDEEPEAAREPPRAKTRIDEAAEVAATKIARLPDVESAIAMAALKVVDHLVVDDKSGYMAVSLGNYFQRHMLSHPEIMAEAFRKIICAPFRQKGYSVGFRVGNPDNASTYVYVWDPNAWTPPGITRLVDEIDFTTFKPQ